MKRLILSILLFNPLFVFCQYNFFKGYVVTNVGDTLKGLVYGKESVVTPKSVRFKENLDAAVKQFDVADCKAFGIYNKDTYERFTVNISQAKQDLDNLPIGPDTTNLREQVFLKVLQAGKNVTIYAYADYIKERYYIKDREMTEPFELHKQLYRHQDMPGKIVENNRYQSTLSSFFTKYEVDERKQELLKNLIYEQSGMVNVGYLINHEQKKKSVHPASSVYMAVGASLVDARYRGTDELADPSTVSKVSVSPYLGMGVDIYTNPAYGRTLIRTELGLFYNNSDFYRRINGFYVKEIRHRFKQYNLILTANLVQNLYNSARFKAYLGAGFSFTYAWTVDNNLETTYNTTDVKAMSGPDLEKTRLAFPLKAGVVVNKKIELAAVYQFSEPLTNYSNFGIWARGYRLSVNYHFAKLF